MAVACRSSAWKEDSCLEEELKRYVRQGMERTEIRDFVKRDFPQYTWSIRTLDRRLRYFGIFYTDRDITVEQVNETVAKELEGPGRLLGYRAMQKKIRQEYHLNVPRDVVYATMMDLDPEGLEERAIGHKKKKKKGVFTSKGTNWVHSLDGHGKLMGFQQNTYPLAVYGCIDTASRKLLWLKVWTRNCDPEVIGRWYLEWLYETRILPSQIRVDHGAETGVMATMHAYLRQYHDDMVIDPKDTVIFGTSTANQVCHSS